MIRAKTTRENAEGDQWPRVLSVSTVVLSLDFLESSNSGPCYALSYKWGLPEMILNLNGSIVQVSSNVDAALRQFLNDIESAYNRVRKKDS
jgi:hypothetical protein